RLGRGGRLRPEEAGPQEREAGPGAGRPARLRDAGDERSGKAGDPVTPAELPGYLEAIRARVEAAAVPVVAAIAETYKEHLVGFTLHESGSHPPVTRTPAVPGRPPAFMPGGVNGSLAGSVTKTPGTGGGG